MVDTLERTNGHRQPGRAERLPSFTFPDSGITVGLRRFSPDLQDTIARAYTRDNPPPAVPQLEVDYDGETRLEPNPADPDYQEAMRQYWQGVSVFVSQKMVELAFDNIKVEVDAETVAEMRSQMEKIGTPIDPALSDRDVYIRFVCISSTYDLTSMIAYLQRRSLPTEVAVQEFLESFQRDV